MWVTFGSPAYEKSLTVGDQSYSQDLSTIPITHIQCFSKVLYRSHWGTSKDLTRLAEGHDVSPAGNQLLGTGLAYSYSHPACH